MLNESLLAFLKAILVSPYFDNGGKTRRVIIRNIRTFLRIILSHLVIMDFETTKKTKTK